MNISNQHVTVTFVNLTLVNPDGVDDCQHCNLVVDVHYLLSSVVNENHVTTLRANVLYGSFQMQVSRLLECLVVDLMCTLMGLQILAVIVI